MAAEAQILLQGLKPCGLFWLSCCFTSQIACDISDLRPGLFYENSSLSNQTSPRKTQGPAEQLGPELPRFQVLTVVPVLVGAVSSLCGLHALSAICLPFRVWTLVF